jgi:S-DNA-T family DNA segregation ATPase FtsK/SpoIIIE
MRGAEELLGAGDMLYLSGEMSTPRRIQSAYVSESEVKKVVKYLVGNMESLPQEITLTGESVINHGTPDPVFSSSFADSDEEVDDDLYEEAKQTVIEAGKASTSYIQRKLRVGYARAARLMDILEEKGVIGPADGSKPREVLHGKDGGSSSGNDMGMMSQAPRQAPVMVQASEDAEEMAEETEESPIEPEEISAIEEEDGRPEKDPNEVF